MPLIQGTDVIYAPSDICLFEARRHGHVPFQLGYRPRTFAKNQKAPTFGRSLRELKSELRVLWTDQSRTPSAIDAPSHNGFGLYSHFQVEYSTVIALQSCSCWSPLESMESTGVHRSGTTSGRWSLVDPFGLLQRADVLDDRIAPAINVHPLAVTDTVLVAGHINHVRLLGERSRSDRLRIALTVAIGREHQLRRPVCVGGCLSGILFHRPKHQRNLSPRDPKL
jgi:hypothetical protein